MRNIVDSYGKNAGKIWTTLETQGSLSENKLIKTTKLDEDEFYAAVGWLARENKIIKQGSVYRLGQSRTNWSKTIGRNAGKIWKTLENWGEVDAPYLPTLTNLTVRDAYSALGWLAKEGKLHAKWVKPKKPQMKFKIR